MKTVLWILVLLTLSAVTLSKPSKKKSDVLEKLLSQYESSSSDKTSCKKLSQAAGDLIKAIIDMDHKIWKQLALSDDIQAQVDDATTRIYAMLFGFDIIHDDKAREDYTCDITDVKTLSELKSKLEQDDFLFNLFRLMYDYTAVALPAIKHWEEASHQNISIFTFLESSGFFGLDTERTAWMKEIFNKISPEFQQLMGNYIPAAPYEGTDTAKCAYASSTINALINKAVQQSPNGLEDDVNFIKMLLGFDITDNQRMKDFICDILCGANEGVSGIYDILDERDIFTRIFKIGYGYLRQSFVPGMQQVDKELDTMKQNNLKDPSRLNGLPNQFNSDPVAFRRNYKPAKDSEVYPEIGEYPGNTNPEAAPAGFFDSLFATDVMTKVLEFMQALQDSGLISLPDDLQIKS